MPRRKVSKRRVSKRRVSKRRTSRRRVSKRRTSRRKRNFNLDQRGGEKDRLIERIPQFCTGHYIKEDYRDCTERNLVTIEWFPMKDHNFPDGSKSSDFLGRIKQQASTETVNYTIENTLYIKGFYAIDIEQKNDQKSGTIVLEEDKHVVFKDNLGAEYNHLLTKRGKPKKRFAFNRGKGAEILKQLLNEKKNSFNYVLLQPSGGHGLMEYYRGKGFKGPIDVPLVGEIYEDSPPMKIMYGTVTEILSALSTRL